MFRKFTATLLLFALATGAAVQGADRRGDIGLEASAGNVTIPTSDRGSIAYKRCDSCREQEYAITAVTRYEIGELQVNRDAMRRELLSRPKDMLLLQLTPDHLHVARVVIAAPSF